MWLWSAWSSQGTLLDLWTHYQTYWEKCILEHPCASAVCNIIRSLSRKYPAILNISRTSRMALMWLGSQSEETLLRIRDQSLSQGTIKSAVRCCWRSLCTVWPSHSQWLREQVSESASMHLPILQLMCRFFWRNIASPRSVSTPTAQIWLPVTSSFYQS
jgi:hypothetical protein